MLVAEGEDSRVDSRYVREITYIVERLIDIIAVLSRMIRDDRVEEHRQRGLQESLKELEDLMAE